MKNNFIPYTEALDLKELGFDEECFTCYNPTKKLIDWFNDTDRAVKNSNYDNPRNIHYVAAPLYQQAFKFFRDDYNLLGNVYSNACGYLWEIHDDKGGTHRYESDYDGDDLDSGTFTTFEKAELACLKKLIEHGRNNIK